MEKVRCVGRRRSGRRKRIPNPSLGSWLQHVDEKWSSNSVERLELLILGLGSEIDSLKTLQQVKTASEIYRALLQRKKELDEEKVLQMFTSVMRNDLMGENLVQQLSRYEISCPKPLEKDEMSDDFKLHHLLLQICINVKGTNIEEFLILSLSRNIRSHGKFTSLAQIFMKMTGGPNPHLNWSNIKDNYLVQLLQNQGASVIRLVDKFLRSMGESPPDIVPLQKESELIDSILLPPFQFSAQLARAGGNHLIELAIINYCPNVGNAYSLSWSGKIQCHGLS